MEEHVYSYLKKEHPNKIMKKIKKELHSILPVDNCILDIEVLKKGTFLKKKIFLSVYNDHIIAFKEKNQKNPLSIIFFEFSLKVEWLYHSKNKENQKPRLSGFKLISIENNQMIEFYSQNEKDLSSIYKILNSFINIVGFHENYKALKKIGKGSFASVYLVSHKETDVQYAVKAFSKEAVFSQDNGKESLINELNMMRLIDHHNILKLYEVCETENSLYMIMDLVQGGSLIEKIREQITFTLDQSIQIMSGMLKAIEHCHNKGIMHRDIKPENILFRTNNMKEEDVILADFGLSTLIHEKKYLFFRCGTPGYVAPEVINLKDENATYSEVCDIFSLGVIFHIMLLGKSPFPGKTYNEVINENKICAIDFNHEKYAKISKKARSLLKKMLEKDPKKRITASQTLSHKFFNSETLENNDDSQGTPLIMDPNYQSDLTTMKEKINSINSLESPNTLILNSHKGNTADILKISKKEDFDNVSKQLVSREPIMNGLTKTVEFVTDNLLQSAEMDFKDKRKFRKESLQVKIFNNKNGEMISPSLKKDLEDYKMKNEKQPDSTKVITPMLVIKENNEEEEEKKN